jgi:hypothetical protein
MGAQLLRRQYLDGRQVAHPADESPPEPIVYWPYVDRG